MVRKVVVSLVIVALGVMVVTPLASAKDSSPASISKAKKKHKKLKKKKKNKSQTKSTTVVLPSPKGDKGDRGETGPKGDKGDSGNGSDVFETSNTVTLISSGIGSTVARLSALEPASYTFDVRVNVNSIIGAGTGSVDCRPYIEPTGFTGVPTDLPTEFRDIDLLHFEVGTASGHTLVDRQNSHFSRTITQKSDLFVQCSVPTTGSVEVSTSLTAMKVNSITRR